MREGETVNKMNKENLRMCVCVNECEYVNEEVRRGD